MLCPQIVWWILKNRVTIAHRDRAPRVSPRVRLCAQLWLATRGVGLKNYGREPHCIWPRKDASAQVPLHKRALALGEGGVEVRVQPCDRLNYQLPESR
jgi:hypothetical protein